MRITIKGRSSGGLLAVLLAGALLAGCGGGGSQSLDGISSCLKGKHFTVKRSPANPATMSKGFLTVNDANLDVLMTVDVFENEKAAKASYDYDRRTHRKAKLKGKIELSGDEKGAAAKQFDSCVS
jgi:hypothetical protein